MSNTAFRSASSPHWRYHTPDDLTAIALFTTCVVWSHASVIRVKYLKHSKCARQAYPCSCANAPSSSSHAPGRRSYSHSTVTDRSPHRLLPNSNSGRAFK